MREREVEGQSGSKRGAVVIFALRVFYDSPQIDAR